MGMVIRTNIYIANGIYDWHGSFFMEREESLLAYDATSIMQDKLVALANIATFTSGAIMIGLSSFLPTYVQGVMGRTAVVAGFTLTMMSVGWPLASTFAGYIFLKIGYRKTAIIGGTALLVGSIFFITLDASKGPVWAGIGSFVTGIGM